MKKIIYQNQSDINLTLAAYNKALVAIQQAVDSIKETGLKIEDDVLLDLVVNNGLRSKELAERQIKDEADKFVLRAMQEQVLDQLQPLIEKIDAATHQVYAALHVNDNTSFSATLSIDHFIIKDLDVDLIDNLEELITEKHTIYADESTENLLDLAEAVKKSIDSLNAAFKERGSQLNAFRDNPYPWGYSIFRYEEGELKIIHEAFTRLNK